MAHALDEIAQDLRREQADRDARDVLRAPERARKTRPTATSFSASRKWPQPEEFKVEAPKRKQYTYWP
jgi:hypothetical protein